MTRRTWTRVILVITAGAFLLGASCQGPQGPQSPTGIWPRFAYVANENDGTVSIYTVHPFSGQLRHNGYAPTGGGAPGQVGRVFVAADSAGQLLYIADQLSSELWVYRIDSATGSLTRLSKIKMSTPGYPYSVAVDPLGKFVYMSSSGNALFAYTVDPATGSLTPVAGSPFTTGPGPASVAVHPTGKFVYVANGQSVNVSAFQVDRSAGPLTPPLSPVNGSPFVAGSAPQSIAVDPSGKFAYVANFLSDTVSAYGIDATTGALIKRGQDVASGSGPSSVTVDPLGKFVYVTNLNSGDVSAYTLNATTGVLTEVPPPRVAAPGSVTVDPSGQYAYVVNSGSGVSVYWINSGTGALTLKGTVRGRQGPIAMAMTQGSNPVRYTPKFAYVAGYFTVLGYQIDPTTGALSRAQTSCCAGAPGTFGSGKALFSVAAYPPGQFASARAQFAYAANWGDNNVLVMGIDPTSGALTNAGTKGAGQGPSSVAVDPSGRFAYVVNDTSNDVWALHSPNIPPIGTGTKPRSVVVDPTGQFMYVANNKSNDVSMYRIDPAGGTLTALGTVAAGNEPIAVTVHPSGRFAFVVGSEVATYEIDAGSGKLTAVSTVSPGGWLGEIAVDPSGRFAYVLQSSTAHILAFSIDNMGKLTEVLPRRVLSFNPGSVTVDPSGSFVYVASFGSSDVFAFTIMLDGSLTLAGTSGAGINARSVTTVGIIE